MAKKIIHHDRDCDDCKDLEKEKTFIESYREFFKDDMRQVVREEWNEHVNNSKRIDTIDRWMWKVEFHFGPVYFLSVAVVLIILYLIFDKIY